MKSRPASVLRLVLLLALSVPPALTAQTPNPARNSGALPLAANASQPVPPPAEMDARYDAEGLLFAFRSVCQQLGIRIRHVAVDRTEFPFLVHGVLEGHQSHHDLRDTIDRMPGYAYVGSTTARLASGTTIFALNMVPVSTYPADYRAAISKRYPVRLKQLRDAESRR